MMVTGLVRRILVGVLCTVLFCVSGAALGQSSKDLKYSLDDAVKMVRNKIDGEVVRAETRKKSGHVIHRIRVITRDGRVRTFEIDARTGKPAGRAPH